MSDDVLVLKESADYEPDIIPQDTEIPAVIKKVEFKDSFFEDKETGEKEKRVSFCAELQGPEWKFQSAKDNKWYQKRVWGDTSTTFSTNSKCRLYAWVKEILGIDELPTGFNLRVSDLEGNPVIVVIGEQHWEDKKTKEKKARNYIQDIRRPKVDPFALRTNEEPF